MSGLNRELLCLTYTSALLAGIAILMLASITLAQDDEAPRVVAPEDIPGADVVMLEGQSYLLDATGSTDNVGIVLYRWEITDPAGATTIITSTTPTKSWTPAGWGLYKVISWVYDGAGNKAGKVFVIDVAEDLGPQVISNTKVTYDHSVAIEGGELKYTNAEIDLTGGLQSDPPSYPTGEMLSDGLVYTGLPDGSLAGKWGPNDPRYGSAFEETSRVLVGKMSIANSGGTRHYGLKFIFDQPEDLTDYLYLNQWFMTDYAMATYYWTDFCDESGSYLRIYPATTSYHRLPGTWLGVSVSLDLDNVGYIRNYGLTDLTNVKEIRMRFYGYSNSVLIDGVGFSKEEPLDNMTESANPTGSFGGTWVGFSDGDVSYVGDKSVYRRTTHRQRFDMEYDWNNPVDLSYFNAIRLYVWYSTAFTNGYLRPYSFLFVDADGDSAEIASTTLPFLHKYETDRYSHWSLAFIPFDHRAYTETGSMDWTRVSKMVIEIYPYRAGDLYLDGFEFYQSKKFSPSTPGVTEDLAHGIYVLPTGRLVMDNVDFDPTGPFGGFVMAWDELIIRESTLDGLWGTTHRLIPLEGSTWGGILSRDCKVTLEDVVVYGAASSAFTLINSDVTATDVIVDGVGTDHIGAVGMALLYLGTEPTSSASVVLTRCEVTQTALGSGLHLLLSDAEGSLDARMDQIDSSSNVGDGIIISLMGTVGNVNISISDSDIYENEGSGIVVINSKAIYGQSSKVTISLASMTVASNLGSGIRMDMGSSLLDIDLAITDVDTETNSANGLELLVNDCTGRLGLNLSSVSCRDNLGDGVLVSIDLNPFSLLGESTIPDMHMDIALLSCDIRGNSGNGMKEDINAISSTSSNLNFPPFAHHSYSLTAQEVSFSDNRGNGYHINEVKNTRCDRVADYSFIDSEFDNNDGRGFFLYEEMYLRSVITNQFSFTNTSFNHNQKGLDHQIPLAFESMLSFTSCVMTGNDEESFYVHGSNDLRYLRYAGIEYDIRDSTIDNPIFFSLDGARIEPGYSNRTLQFASVSFYDCAFGFEFPVRIMLGAYYQQSWQPKYLFPMEAKVVFKGNTFAFPSRSDGLNIEMWGSTALEGKIVIEDMVFDTPGHDGINIFMGSRATNPTHPNIIYGSVLVSNVTIKNPGRNGILMTAKAVNDILALKGVLCHLSGVTIDNAMYGARFDGVDVEITNCTFSRISLTSIMATDCTVDLRNSLFGEIHDPNLRALGEGKIKLRFKLQVQVLWKDSTDPVIGARVQLINNAYITFGFGEVTGEEPITFSDLNAITIIANGIIRENPYRISASYLGLLQHRLVHITSDTMATVWLLDDVPPILNLLLPEDGTEQTSNVIQVEGTAYDVHRNVDRIMVSVDDIEWTMADGTEVFNYIVRDVPDGAVIVRVRAFDAAGNWAEILTTVLVDTTPPYLIVMSPQEGLVTSDPVVRVLATTDAYAKVLVNQEPVSLTYTLIDHSLSLVEGQNTIVVTATDAIGNTAQALINVTLDTIPPTLSITSHDAWMSVRSSPILLKGITEPGNIQVQVGGVQVPVDEMGRFEVDVHLSTGRNDVTILVVDAANNKYELTIPFFLDQEPPQLTVTEPLDGGIFSWNLIQVSGFIEPGCTVFVGNQMSDIINGQFTTQVSLPDGTHVIHVTAVDDAGNEQAVDVIVTIDTVPPVVDILAPEDGLLITQYQVTVSGVVSGEDLQDVTVDINGEIVQVGPDGGFEQELTLVQWTNLVTVTARDGAGNVRKVEFKVLVDSIPPFVEFTISGAELDASSGIFSTQSDSIQVTGFAEIGSTVSVNGVAVDLDSTTGRFSITLKLPSPGGADASTTIVRVIAIDAAGNTDQRTETVERKVLDEGSEVSAWGLAVLIVSLLVAVVAIFYLLRFRSITSQDDVTQDDGPSSDPSSEDPEGEVDR